MVRAHLLDTSQFGVDHAPIVAVDCSTGAEDGRFDAEHAKRQARKLKKQVGVAAVIVQFDARFWVV